MQQQMEQLRQQVGTAVQLCGLHPCRTAAILSCAALLSHTCTMACLNCPPLHRTTRSWSTCALLCITVHTHNACATFNLQAEAAQGGIQELQAHMHA
jgi:hypothetical protein